MRLGLFSRAWTLDNCWLSAGRKKNKRTCAHEGVISRVSGTLSSLYFWLWIMVAYKRRCRGCRDWGRKSPNEPREEGGGADRDEWMLRRHIGGVCRMQMGDIDDIALGGSGIRCTERTADIADDSSRWMFFRMRICHFKTRLAAIVVWLSHLFVGFAANLPPPLL